MRERQRLRHAVVRLALTSRTFFANLEGEFPGQMMSKTIHLPDTIDYADAKAANPLLPLSYEELRQLAAWKMANEAAGRAFQSTALVRDAWLRLIAGGGIRGHNTNQERP